MKSPPWFVGRALVHLAADPQVLRKDLGEGLRIDPS
jgi:hypothetical protein